MLLSRAEKILFHGVDTRSINGMPDKAKEEDREFHGPSSMRIGYTRCRTVVNLADEPFSVYTILQSRRFSMSSLNSKVFLQNWRRQNPQFSMKVISRFRSW